MTRVALSGGEAERQELLRKAADLRAAAEDSRLLAEACRRAADQLRDERLDRFYRRSARAARKDRP